MHSNFQPLTTPTPTNVMNTSQPYTNSQREALKFKMEALTILKTAIAQRSKLIALRKSRLVLGTEHKDIINLYAAYCNRWNAETLAKFIVKHENAIIELIPSSNPTLRQRFENVAFVANNFQL